MFICLLLEDYKVTEKINFQYGNICAYVTTKGSNHIVFISTSGMLHSIYK